MGRHTAQVWWASRTDFHQGLTGFFDATERERFASYRLDADRQRFAVGCALAKSVVAQLTGEPVTLDRECPDCGKSHGKPKVVGADVELSVSHSGDMVVAAVAGAPCGVDVEQIGGRMDVSGMARFVLAESEHADDEPEFLRLWTRKEAVTKATGDGLRVPFSKVVLADAPPRVLSWPYPGPPESVSLFDLQAPDGYLAALAVLGPVTNVDIHHGSDLLAPAP
jgi:4'-phosphopantetheinyl transferase